MNEWEAILKPITLGVHTVPGIWRYMLPEDVLYFRVDPEVRASCFNCPQVKAHGFHPSIRCCTYIPRVPNFLLGMALMQDETRPTAENFIATGHVIPEGSQLSPAQLEQSLLFLSHRAPPGSVVCPMLDQASKKCQIYAFRSGVCSTFFCHHDQGEAGHEFWEQLGDLVTQVETALSHWALEQAGFDVPAYFSRFEQLQDQLTSCSDQERQTWSESARRHLFGAWFGRERELFQNCARHVLTHKEDLFAIAGRQQLRQTPQYDRRLREHFQAYFPQHLIQESLPEGEPMPIRQIWYGLQLAHRNLQLSRMNSLPSAD